jgi:site-specific recombinase XerD
MELEPIDLQTALDLYLADREPEVVESTLYAHRSRIDHFVRWCNEQEFENLNELTGRRLHEYRIWRRNDGDLAPPTEKSQMDTLRVFIRWLESVDGVQQDFSTKVLSPSIDSRKHARSVMLEADRAPDILAYLEKYQYASIEHVSVALLWHTMIRIGAAHALDVSDYHSEDQYLEVRHRPEEGTPVKNQENGERFVALSGRVCDLLDDWLSEQRPDVQDDYDRNPLLATPQGRLSKTAIRTYVYQWTQPCRYGQECPHDRSPDDCSARERDFESQCPSSVSPHAIRRGSITNNLNDGMPEKVVSDRANVSSEILEHHYDQRTEREKMEQRRQYLSNL